MIIKLKLLPHVKQFIVAKVGQEPIELTEKNWQTDMLVFRMKSKMKKNSFSANKPMVELQVKLPQTLVDNYKGNMYYYQMENYYDSYFKETMCVHIEALKRGTDYSVKNAIIDFFSLYGIDENSIEISSAAKIFQRYIEQKQKKIK